MGPVTGIAWYSREQWLRLREAADDRDALDDSYEEWLRSASSTLDDLRAQGLDVRPVDINVDDLKAWCTEQRRALNASARADFAVHRMQVLARFSR